MITASNYFNPNGIDNGLIVGNPTGFTNFNDTSLEFSTKHYEQMNNLFWLPAEINCSREAKSFKDLNDNEKMIYKLVFANLSFLDSSQESHLLDFRSKVTHRILRSALTLQAFQESVHSQSYAIVLAEIGNSDEVFNMYQTEQILYDRNSRVAELFARHINGRSSDEMMTSAVASILLEGILFLTSFTYVYVLGEKMQGSSSMVAKINNDENVHMSLFANIFRTMRKQMNVSQQTIDECYKMIDEAVNIELDFGRYLCENYPILGVTYKDIQNTVYNYANNRLSAIGFNPRYSVTNKNTNLQRLAVKFSKVNETKSNFFESSVKAYSKGVSFDDF